MGGQSGRSLSQMREAPPNAFFVWITSQLKYPRELALFAKRQDLVVVSPEWIEAESFRGFNPTAIVIEHHLREEGWSDKFATSLRIARMRGAVVT